MAYVWELVVFLVCMVALGGVYGLLAAAGFAAFYAGVLWLWMKATE